MEKKEALVEFIERLKDYGPMKSQDYQAYAISLVEEMVHQHEKGKILKITSDRQVIFSEQRLKLTSKAENVSRWDRPLFRKITSATPVEVSDEFKQILNADGSSEEYENLSVLKEFTSEITKPVYFSNYRSWEETFNHYDQVTDIFSVGMVLASVAFGLNFNDNKDLELFVSNRNRLYYLNSDLHPTLVEVISQMTELYREDRIQDAHEVLIKIKNYRELNPEHHIDLTKTEGFKSQDISTRDKWILNRLKNRLYDMSRRNNLLYYKDKEKFVNLTVSSIPHLLNFENIKEDDLLLWNESLAKKLISKKKIELSSYLQFNTNRFLSPRINKIRLEAQKSNNEFGFSPLRTVLAYIHWYNFKENKEEKITSPLLLLKSDLIKKKGVKDSYSIEVEDLVAEVNPVIVQYFKDSFDIVLPDYVDLETSTVFDLVETLQKQVSAGNSGVNISWKRVPKIKLLHSLAKRNLTIRNRKSAKRGKKLSIRSIDYSYAADDFMPLGLEIFKRKIRHKNQHLEYVINEDLSASDHYVVDEKTAKMYSVEEFSATDPYHWEVDTTNMTLGNFNYRKMSLVKDYNDIIESDIKDDVFEKLFSELPSRAKSVEFKRDLDNDFPIVPLDPTQNYSIKRAREGESYVIQGPPGTGKSQTITNLIADYLSRGKKVLFVCEKRAALDVVYHRLKNKGLDTLASIVHDSRSDKKEFIQDLKKTYEDLISRKDSYQKVLNERSKIVSAIDEQLNLLEKFHGTMQKGETPLHNLIQNVLELKPFAIPLEEKEYLELGEFSEWNNHHLWISEWIDLLKEKDVSSNIAECQFSALNKKVHQHVSAKQNILTLANKLYSKLDSLIEETDLEINEDINGLSIEGLIDILSLSQKLLPILKADALEIFYESTEASKEFNSQLKDWTDLNSTIKQEEEKNKHWTSELDIEDLQRVVNEWKAKSKGFFKFLSPGFHKIRKQIRELYDFSAHKVKPNENEVISKLDKLLQLKTNNTDLELNITSKFGVTNLSETASWIKSNQNSRTTILENFLRPENHNQVRYYISKKEEINHIHQMVEELFAFVPQDKLGSCLTNLNALQNQMSHFNLFKPYLTRSAELSDALRKTLITKPWNKDELSFHMSYKGMLNKFEENPEIEHINSISIHNAALAVKELLNSYFEANVSLIEAAVTQQFLNQVRITESSAAQLTDEEKILKKTFKSARKILENEFGKSMRYKSVRELFNNEARSILTTIKPVWLMSPLSLSDIMPISTDAFDVVIFDEASQITLEEGVPALFRTKQIIVVGDEMQMPPTNFFGSQNTTEEDLDQEEEVIGFSLDADSILSQSCRKLSSVMLGWHYRSRRESLISFSNAAFYNRSLLTIPDASIQKGGDLVETQPILNSSEPIDIHKHLEKSISFHYLESGIYDKRKNQEEAKYIAQLVKEILSSDVKKSIGIVAFSMDQQSEIELALEKLGAEDPNFESLLEAEYQRVEEDQFNGLFVKNLENVQGDERDIIILSICYAQNARGKMYMNFGPINRRGGEKRLNVIFSRSKSNMMVVSSILPEEITNDYNEGANYFKKFLSFAQHTSNNNYTAADSVLESLNKSSEMLELKSKHALVPVLSEKLIEKEFKVETYVGQSEFKCDLVISKPETDQKKMAILVDHSQHYSNQDVLEQYVLKPEVLRAFGWKAIHVYAKDWLRDPDQVLSDILTAFKEEKLKRPEVKINAEEKEPRTKLENTAPKTIDQNTKAEPELLATDEPSEFTRLEFKEGSSSKFWQVKTAGNNLIVQFGRIGNKPQERVKTFETSVKAEEEMTSAIRKKEMKGYLRVE